MLPILGTTLVQGSSEYECMGECTELHFLPLKHCTLDAPAPLRTRDLEERVSLRTFLRNRPLLKLLRIPHVPMSGGASPSLIVPNDPCLGGQGLPKDRSERGGDQPTFA